MLAGLQATRMKDASLTQGDMPLVVRKIFLLFRTHGRCDHRFGIVHVAKGAMVGGWGAVSFNPGPMLGRQTRFPKLPAPGKADSKPPSVGRGPCILTAPDV